MARPPFEVADVFRNYGEAYRQARGASMPQSHLRVMHAIETCRTAELGGHVDACTHCGAQEISYNSCRNRHCPKCQSAAKARWLEARQAELLPVGYFHLVFTLPNEIAQIGLQNKRVIYNLLFKATAETLRKVAADPQYLGAEIGFLAVLHTWGQTLTFHPHLHCIVPGGGIHSSKQRWISSREDFFVPVQVLARHFRSIFLAKLLKSYRQGELHFHGELAALENPRHYAKWINRSRRHDWVVYAKKPFGGPRQVLEYLGRYTHRVAISNHRITNVADGKVTFNWRDYRTGQLRSMTLTAEEFTRRFLLHVLPDGFVRIRHFGFLANRHRSESIKMARQLLEAECLKSHAKSSTPTPSESSVTQLDKALEPRRCPRCKVGYLVLIDPRQPRCKAEVEENDSS